LLQTSPEKLLKKFFWTFQNFYRIFGRENAFLCFSTVIGSNPDACGTGISPLLFVLLWKYSPIPTGM